MEAFWGAIRHGSVKLNIHIPSDPFIPVQRGMHAHNRIICGDGEELNVSWVSIPERMGG